MEDGVNVDNNSVIKMGATENPNAARLANLQERKKVIEESLAKCTQELRQLCIQEADLTGIIPLEMPLEPGESPPLVRRRIGTAYQLSENLFKNSNNKDENCTDLELQIQLHANMAEAALGLANEQNISKTLRRKHMTEYQQHKMQYSTLQEKLTCMKEKVHQQEHLHKQKKKPRPTEQDDNVSTTTVEPFVKSELRHSIRSNKCIVTDSDVEQRYPTGYQRTTYQNADIYPDGSYSRQDDSLATGLYRLSINGYKSYMERRENITNMHISYNPQMNSVHYNQHPNIQMNSQYQQQNQILQQHLQHQRSSQNSLQQMYNYNINNPYYNTIQQDYNKFNTIKNQQQQQQQVSPTISHRQSSPNIGTSSMQKINYYPVNQTNYSSRYTNEQNCRTIIPQPNPHQIQPHQQYEHNTLGLGGYWKGSDNGELVWCHTIDTNWQRDKRFGSLDRRKNKRLQKRISPNIDNKSATLGCVPNYTDHVRTASIKSPQIINRRSQDNRQLVRTQSLGSVGAQTVDSVWPSDDNSSCESDNRSINDINQANRKQKQKGWLETSLDAPVSPSHSVVSRSQSAIPSVLSPEDKYIPSPPQHVPVPPPPHHHHHHHHHHQQQQQQQQQQQHVTPSPTPPRPLTPKPPLEIPAESNPSPKIQDTNIELFNNNIPKNCTIVQAGHCKPYHEETKPFEMSDFYKYSTKFKKSPQKQQHPQQDNINNVSPKKSLITPGGSFQKNLNESFDDMAQKSIKNHNINQTLSPIRVDNTSSNSSFDISQLTNANLAEHFSDEMNAWYKSQKFHDNNNEGASKSKSTATLV